MTALVEVFRKIGNDYPSAVGETFADHPIARFVRKDAPEAVRSALPIHGQNLIVKGSAGSGNFATVPWLAVFDPLVTTNARTGFYVVYLYSTTGDLYLSLNQGTTAVRREFQNQAREVLKDRSALIRARLPDYQQLMPTSEINLGSSHVLPRDYEAGHALGYKYPRDLEISEEDFVHDLGQAISAYRSLTYRGGLDPSPEADSSDDDFGKTPKSLEEVRRYRMHRRIERNGRASAMAKFVHGYRCQVCDFDFEEAFGALGEAYIEAHHLRPLSSLAEGQQVVLDAAEDFAVLCSNCHRMIHRTDDPSDLDHLRHVRMLKK